jgi:hypothetical protein
MFGLCFADYLTRTQTNVYLPFPSTAHLRSDKEASLRPFIEQTLLLKYDAFVPIFLHGRKWIARLSNQVWIEVKRFLLLRLATASHDLHQLSDYDRIGKILLALTDDVKEEIKRLENGS